MADISAQSARSQHDGVSSGTAHSAAERIEPDASSGDVTEQRRRRSRERLITAAAIGEPSTESRQMVLVGPIVEIDIERRRMTIDDRERSAIRVEVPEETPIELDGEPGAILEDLFVDDTFREAIVKPTNSGGLYLVRAVIVSEAD